MSGRELLKHVLIVTHTPFIQRSVSFVVDLIVLIHYSSTNFASQC